MAQDMSSTNRGGDPGTMKSTRHHGRHRATGGEGPQRSSDRGEEMIDAQLALSPFEIGQQRIADLLCERECDLATTLTRNSKGGFRPGDVLQTKTDDITRTQSKTGKQQKDCAIPYADSCPQITGGEDALYVGGFQKPWQGGKPPVGH